MTLGEWIRSLTPDDVGRTVRTAIWGPCVIEEVSDELAGDAAGDGGEHDADGE